MLHPDKMCQPTAGALRPTWRRPSIFQAGCGVCHHEEHGWGGLAPALARHAPQLPHAPMHQHAPLTGRAARHFPSAPRHGTILSWAHQWRGSKYSAEPHRRVSLWCNAPAHPPAGRDRAPPSVQKRSTREQHGQRSGSPQRQEPLLSQAGRQCSDPRMCTDAQ